MATTQAPAVGITTAVAPHDLNTYHRNARVGNVDAIAASLNVNGQYKPICVNIGTHTGRPREVLAGNHTLKAFRDLALQHPDDPRWAKILVHWVDVDEDRATRIVLADNKTADMGTYDNEALLELIDSLGGDLDGIGYTTDDLTELADLVDENSADVNSDPIVNGSVISYNLIFDTEAQQDVWFAFLKRLKQSYPDMDTIAERIVAHIEAG
ncbi:MAG: hypothetical protein KDM81_09305 [Verrucomicrobiae bacterium]|nr:hypothetical protein [Verrucomicrobiae bacterium]